jgi:hypothetical protein
LILGIHVENADRRPADSRLSKNVYAAPRKVVFPALVSRMKQLRHPIRLRVNARQVRAFVKITVNASQSQIVEIITTAVEFRENVLDVQDCQRRVVLMQLAVLATIAGALPDAGFRSLIHRSGIRAD